MRVSFEGWVYDSDSRQLLRGSEPVRLSPKAFDLLGALIDRRPAALSKAQLKDLLWPSTFVSDANLPSLVAEVRGALGDDARMPRFLRTVPRFGYAFCAVVPPARTAVRTPLALVWESRRIGLPEGETVLGRSVEAGARIDASSVSRFHARVVVAGGRAMVEDLASKNGTFVADRRIDAPTPLSDGDELRLGRVRLVFRSTAEVSTSTLADGGQS